MLTIYKKRSDVPKDLRIIDNNDVFFAGLAKIPDTPLVSDILKTIDGAKRISDTMFEGKFVKGAIYASCLSTGAKTLLNIIQHPNFCFNVIECGLNALDFIAPISLLPQNTFILWEHYVAAGLDDPTCNICLDGVVYTNYNDLLSLLYYGYDKKKELEEDD